MRSPVPGLRTAAAAFAVAAALVLATACKQDESKPAGGGAVKGTGGTPAAQQPSDGEKWTKTASGLEYQVLTPGRPGESPKLHDTVVCHYKGWLENGKVFDSSYDRKQPETFQVGGVIPGWNEALGMMTPGAKWKLRIPSQLGYGPRGSEPDIPPNATLYFDVELISVTPYVEPPPVPGMPRYVPPNPAAQKTTPSGLKYEVLKEGEGKTPTEDDPMELKYAFFNAQGKLLDCSEIRGTIKARPKDLAFPFLREGPQLMKPGAAYRFEVPAALMTSPGMTPPGTMHCDLEIVRLLTPLPVPPFEPVDESKFKKLPSGLLVQEIKAGEGTAPKLGQLVDVHYAGWLTDGTLFDSSYPKGNPATFQLGTVIKGWNEGVQLMKPGGVARLVIPAHLAYGSSPPPGSSIPANATLVFQIELIAVGK